MVPLQGLFAYAWLVSFVAGKALGKCGTKECRRLDMELEENKAQWVEELKEKARTFEKAMAEKDPEFYLRYIKTEYNADTAEDYECGSLNCKGIGWDATLKGNFFQQAGNGENSPGRKASVSPPPSD